MRRILSTLLVLLLFVSAVPFAAEAAEYTVTMGQAESLPFGMMASSGCTYTLSGSVPGMELVQFRGAMTLDGTPTAAGTYYIALKETSESGAVREELMTVHVTDPNEVQIPSGSGSPVVTKHPTGEKVAEGDSAQFVARADNTRQYVWELLTTEGATVPCAQLPGLFQGLVVTGADTERLTLSNIPVGLDGCRVRCRFVGAEDSAYSDYAYVEVLLVPKVTKHPTGETVTEGGMAQFVSRASNIEQYLWMLESPDGRVSYPCTGSVADFPDLKISGGSTECLTLNAIPYEMNGWKVYCAFSGSLGNTASDTALITVTPLPTEATTAPTEPSTEHTAAPTTQPTEPPTEATAAPTEAPVQPAQPLEEPEEETASGGNTLAVVAIVCAAVVAVAAIAAVVILKLYGRPAGRYTKEDEDYEYEDGEE